jgi:hypothetical protein
MGGAPLQTELQVYEANKAAWSQSHTGKFVVIQDDKVVDDFFDQYEDAFWAGVRRFGRGRSFLIKQVWESEPVYFVG